MPNSITRLAKRLSSWFKPRAKSPVAGDYWGPSSLIDAYRRHRSPTANELLNELVLLTSVLLPSHATNARPAAISSPWSWSQPGTGARVVIARVCGSITAIWLRDCTSTSTWSLPGS